MHHHQRHDHHEMACFACGFVDAEPAVLALVFVVSQEAFNVIRDGCMSTHRARECMVLRDVIKDSIQVVVYRIFLDRAMREVRWEFLSL